MKIEGATRAKEQNHPNEDAFAYFTIPRHNNSNQSSALAVAVVADGIGGNPAADEASQLAVSRVQTSLKQANPSETISRQLEEAVQVANRSLQEAARTDPSKSGMGTTITVAAIANDLLYIAHVGNSPVYLLREGKLYRCTRDHTRNLSSRVLPALTEEQRLTRQLGKLRHVDVDLSVDLNPHSTDIRTLQIEREHHAIELKAGDKVLIATDGLSLSRNRLQEQLTKRRSPKVIANDLIEQIPEGHDDVTAVVMQTRKPVIHLIGYVLAALTALLLLVVVAGTLLTSGTISRPTPSPSTENHPITPTASGELEGTTNTPSPTETTRPTATYTPIPPTITPNPRETTLSVELTSIAETAEAEAEAAAIATATPTLPPAVSPTATLTAAVPITNVGITQTATLTATTAISATPTITPSLPGPVALIAPDEGFTAVSKVTFRWTDPGLPDGYVYNVVLYGQEFTISAPLDTCGNSDLQVIKEARAISGGTSNNSLESDMPQLIERLKRDGEIDGNLSSYWWAVALYSTGAERPECILSELRLIKVRS